MWRRSCKLPVVAAFIVAASLCAGCGSNAKYLTEDRLANGLVIILPGIEGHSAINEGIRRGLVAGGVHRGLPIRQWGTPVPIFGLLINQMDFVGNRLAGKRLAKSIIEYQDEYPGRPVYIIGHSAGGGVAVFTAEALPEGRQVDGLILLSASISSGYDLQKALSRCRNGIVNFYNKGDSGLLGVGTVVLGTVDGTHGVSAGLVGFDNFDKPGYEGLYQVKMNNVSKASHTTSTQAGFVSSYVTPWVLSDDWPAMPGNAYLDEVPPTGGVDGSRLAGVGKTNGKSDVGSSLAAADKTDGANVLTGRPLRPRPPTATRKPPQTPSSTHMDETLLAQSRARNGVPKTTKTPRPPIPVVPRRPADKTLDPPHVRPGEDAAEPDDMLPPYGDIEDEADPASIGKPQP